MAVNQYTEVTRQGFGQKMANSAGGAILGFVLFIAAFPVLFLNEGSEVKRLKGLAEGQKIVVEASADSVDAAKEGALVCVSGNALTADTLTDNDFGLSLVAARLERTVEMFQWVEESKSETKDKVGGGTETVTTYNYKKDWSTSLSDSSKFKISDGHQNPASMPYQNASYQATNVTLGAFALNADQIAQIGTLIALADGDLANAAAVMNGTHKAQGGFIFIAQNPAAPQVGDVRVSFKAAQPGPVTIVAKQQGSSFAPYSTKNTTIDLLKNDIMSSQQMFAAAVTERKTLTWIIRIIGLIMMVFGLGLIMKPLSSALSFLPILGTISGGLLGVASFLIGFGLSFITIAVAWVIYRPLIGIALLAIGAALIVVPGVLAKKKQAAAAQ